MTTHSDFPSHSSSDFCQENVSLPFFGELSPGKRLDRKKLDKQARSKINIPNYLNVSKKCFVIRMGGDSMQASGLYHNDLLVIKPSSTAKNGAIVIATIDDLETVIKHFEQTNDLILLSSKNSNVKPMIFDPSRIKITGILVSQLRSY